MSQGPRAAGPVWVPSAQADDHGNELPLPEGEVIRLMYDEGVDAPLWTTSVGLLYSGEDDLVAHGAAPEIARALAQWAARVDERGRHPELDREALELLPRLEAEFGHRYRFVYQA